MVTDIIIVFCTCMWQELHENLPHNDSNKFTNKTSLLISSINGSRDLR